MGSDAYGGPGRLTALAQHLLPQHGLTRLAHGLSHSRLLAPAMISIVRRLYAIDLDDYQVPASGFDCFDAFFTRKLKPEARRWPVEQDLIASPCDGRLSQLGGVRDGHILQAKGRSFTCAELLGDAGQAGAFDSGRFITIYLAPDNYHRVHLPMNGTLIAETRIPGKLFSVSDATSRHIERLYARNERMVALFETVHGPMAVVMVAAMLVAGIETAWSPDSPLRPADRAQTKTFGSPAFRRGDELGTFHWGSTVIVLTAAGAPEWRPTLAPGQAVRLGQALSVNPGTDPPADGPTPA